MSDIYGNDGQEVIVGECLECGQPMTNVIHMINSAEAAIRKASHKFAAKTSAIELLQSGPFSLREVAIKNFDEFFDSIIEQNALTEEQHATLGNYLKESIEKRDRLGAFLKRIEAEAKTIRDEENRLAGRRREFEKIGEAMRESIRMQLDNWGVKKVEGQKFTFSLHKSPSAVEITDEAQIPAEFIDYKPTVRKNDVAKAIAEGREVPGAKVYPERTHLVIR